MILVRVVAEKNIKSVVWVKTKGLEKSREPGLKAGSHGVFVQVAVDALLMDCSASDPVRPTTHRR